MLSQKRIQFITSILLIITLTMANFLLLCADFVSYAAESINIEKATNHKNVEFMAYFKDANGNKIKEKDVLINVEDLKLYFQIDVKNEGYLNGKIKLGNSNFKLNTDIIDESITKIEDNIIYLNQINAGQSEEIEVKIEISKYDQFDLDLINCESEIELEGVYRDRTQKDISINAERNVSLILGSPYNDVNENIILTQDIITNKIFKMNGQNKRVIQVSVNSGMKDNLFPVNKTIINIQAPKISDTYPEKVLVNTNNILVTSGKNLTEGNWNYDNATGITQINIENVEKDGEVSWIKQGTDNFIITYIFDENVQINNDKININSEIELYDTNKTICKAANEIVLNNIQKDSVITTEIIQNETSIYKGKMYAGIPRDITYKNVINVNLSNVIGEVNVQESKQTLGNRYIKSLYKTTRINKEDINNILGENGTFKIINLNDNSVISTINKNTVANDDGYIVIQYSGTVETVAYKIEAPESIGRIEIENTKTISDVNANVLRNENKISLKSPVSYISDSKENKLPTVESVVDLKETETTANLEINRNQLFTLTPNDDVEFRITLNSREEKHELYKNPVVKLQLPDEIESINVNSIKLVYEDELTVKSAVLNGNTIIITLNGQQTNYKEEAVDGALILINADLQVNKRVSSSVEQIKLTCTNNGKVREIVKDIEIVSYAGVVATNQISEYGIDVVNNEGNEKAQLTVSDNEKTVTIEKKIINNKENKISEVKVLGVFPTKNTITSNNIDVDVKEISVTGVDESRVKIYYSNNENATQDINDSNNNWTQTIQDNKNVKKYLVVIDQLNLLEEVNLSYQMTIPSNLEYNESAQEGYTVYYKNVTVEEQVNTKSIRLTTPAGTVVETTLKTLVAGQEVNKVKENGVLRYKINVANTGSEDVSNVVVNAIVPEGTVFVNSQDLNKDNTGKAMSDIVFAEANKKEIQFVIENLKHGEEVVKYYEVQVNENMTGNNITNVVTTKYGEVSKNSNEVVTLVEDGDLELKLISIDAENSVVKSGYNYRYVLYITNKSNQEIKNVETTLNVDNIFKVLTINYRNHNDETITMKNTNKIRIEKIAGGSTVQVAVNAKVAIFDDVQSKPVEISAVANYNNNEQYSNQIDLIAKTDLVFSLNVTSPNSGNYVKAGDVIRYNVTIKNEGKDTVNEVVLNNWISNDVALNKVIKDAVQLTEEQYSFKMDNAKKQRLLKIVNTEIEPGSTVEIQIEVIVNTVYGDVTEIISDYSLQLENYEMETAKIIHILQPEEIVTPPVEGDDGNGDNNGDDDNEGNNPELPAQEYRIISGIAWLDENENGQKDIDESLLEGLEVKLLNAETNEFVKDEKGEVLSTQTTENGFYNFSNIEKGQYIVIFEYETKIYGLTTFEKEGISNEINSNVITKTINIDGTERQIAATEIINVDKENVSSINIGLITAKKYDLQLDKYVSKVIVQNNKTETTTYTDSTLVKQEIDAKQVNSTTVIVEYTIRVTNKGDVNSYVKKIADYLPADYKFNSQLNKDWYQSENDLYCTSLSNEKIQPGESKEVKLTVIKEMTENNIGLINNTAEIVQSYNELGLTDINSVEGNKSKEENDMGSADVIISIKTGQVVTTISLIIGSIVILGVAIVLLKRNITRKSF